MKVATRVVAVLAILASATMANAATHVWFTASSPTGQAGIGIGGPGGPGTNADLTCDTTLANASCSWTITMAFQNDVGDPAISSWANDLATRENLPGKVLIVAGSFQYASNNFANHAPASGPTLGSGPALLTNADGLDFGAGGTGGVLGTFTLRKLKSAPGSTNTVHIFLTSGGVEWANTNGDYPDMQAGGNLLPVAAGGAGGTDLGDVITIRNSPEPASLSLLGLGALALIRRRR